MSIVLTCQNSYAFHNSSYQQKNYWHFEQNFVVASNCKGVLYVCFNNYT